MATRRYNVPMYQDISTRYASDLNDQEFELIAPPLSQIVMVLSIFFMKPKDIYHVCTLSSWIKATRAA